MDVIAMAQDNLGSPMVLCFILGLGLALIRADLSVPEQAARMMSIYLLLAIGMKGGVEIARAGLGPDILLDLAAGIALSVAVPVVAYAILRLASGLSAVDAAAAAGHYGSISIVTFVAAAQALDGAGLDYAGHMVAVAAVMEAPAIIVALWLAARGGTSASAVPMREILLNGSIVLLCGGLLIGWISGPEGFSQVTALMTDPFKGVLCLFLLDMGLLAGRNLRQSRAVIEPAVMAFGLFMPVIGGAVGAAVGLAAGMAGGNLALLITLAASASYIAAPAALRIALPTANPGVYLTLSLGLTFPFNLTVGIPLYIVAAQFLSA